MMNRAYQAELRRHESTISRIAIAESEMIDLTINVFIAGNAIDKHDNIRAVNLPGVHPALLWNGDLVADQPTPGLICLNHNRYPVTKRVETLLYRKGWIQVESPRPHEDVWVDREMLRTIVQEWLETADV